MTAAWRTAASGGSAFASLRYFVACAVPAASAIGIAFGNDGNWLGVAVYGALYVFWDSLGRVDASAPAARNHPLLTAALFIQLPLLLFVWVAFLASFAAAGPAAGGSAGLGGGIFAALGLPRHGGASAADLAGAALSFALTITLAGTVTAHELVHRTSSRAAQLAGRIQLAFIFDAAFSIEHVYGHHARVATREDPATARRGENLYRFVLRSTVQSFRGAWAIEAERLARAGRSLWSWRNRNLRGIALSLALLTISAVAAGPFAAGASILCGLFAKALLEATNYLEHYGLARAAGTRVRPHHSWDTAAPISAIGMFNLSRHAAHHVQARPYAMLALESESPKLPSGIVGSAFIAAVPPLWRRVMAPRLARWDREQATDQERRLAVEAGTRVRGGASAGIRAEPFISTPGKRAKAVQDEAAVAEKRPQATLPSGPRVRDMTKERAGRGFGILVPNAMPEPTDSKKD